MYENVTNALQAASTGVMAIPLAFLLGLVSAVASACCTLPALGMLIAYSGMRGDTNRKKAISWAISFMVGTTLALIILGFVAGVAGQAAQNILGRSWKLFAGAIAILFGLASLKMLPVKMPQWKRDADPLRERGIPGTVIVGMLLGGGLAACSLPCNPGIFIVLGAAVLQGRILWGMVLMSAFAVGFSIPLSAVLLGISFGKTSIRAQRAEAAIRVAAGVLLVLTGFYLLAQF